ncbi:MAG: hypothetical protein F7B60_02045 [Desulfurococcales archaeon]|nr:hypothetical protein [Desulfurococcales archaeon]
MPAPWKGGWGRGFGRGWWGPPAPPVAPPAPFDPAAYAGKAAELLKTATKGTPYTYATGIRIPLLKDSIVVGELWADVDLTKASIGWIRPCRWGVWADIVYEGRVVGVIYVEGYPYAWGPGPGWGYGRGYGRGFWSWSW